MAPKILNENTFNHSGDKVTFYWSAGPVNGPLIIFIHGWPANGETWKPQMHALAALGFRVLAPDNRGYGRSSVPQRPSDYALEHHVSDMCALLAHVGREKAVWVGHDWGAGLVWALAAQHPEKCVGVCGMAVPYHVLEWGTEALVALSNRALYPEDEYPLAQWDYQAYHVEQPAASAAQLGANVRNTIQLLYQAGSPARYGQPSYLASLRTRGGWWGGAPAAPAVPLETMLLKDDQPALERLVAEFEKNGFEGPNSYYCNKEANTTYTKKAPNGGRLPFPVLFIEARWDGVCDTSLSRLAEPMRDLCEDLTEVSVEAGHWVALEKAQETNAVIVRWIATKLPTYFPGYWKTPFVSRK